MRRTLVVLCAGGPYHVPSLARVALFPLHLDPPTRQHRELFRLLLGAPDLATSSVPSLQPPSSSQLQSASPASEPSHSAASSIPSESPASSTSSTGLAGRLQGLLHRHSSQQASSEASTTTPPATAVSSIGSSSSPSPSPPTAAAAAVADLSEVDPISCGNSSPFWYMEAFATSLREDSQLAPFDDIILIPNTRGPVSLRQSTHLAALAVLATRGLAHVHVDFTALEHPDESMPIVYELICKYPNSVLVHWLQDAYEMLNWSHFSEFKHTVPMLLLQTQSYPPRALERQRPIGSVSRLTSRQYHSPMGPYIHSPEEAEYYRGAERFMQASASLRRRHPTTPLSLSTGGAASGGGSGGLGGEGELLERYESASLLNRETDFFDDVPDLAEGASSLSPPGQLKKVLSRSPLLRGEEAATRTASINTHDAAGGTGANTSSGVNSNNVSGSSSSAMLRSPSALASHDHQLGMSYADCAKGRWWNTPGGRGDDEVEVSRSYWSSTSSSWLGGGGGATSSLPDWMEDMDAMTDRLRHGPRRSSAHGAGNAAPRFASTTPTNVSDPAYYGGGIGAEEDEVGAALMDGGIRGMDDLDTVVSDDGFALAVDEQQQQQQQQVTGEGDGCDSSGECGDAATAAKATSPSSGEGAPSCRKSVQSPPAAGAVPCSTKNRACGKGSSASATLMPTSPDTRESADEDTRKRYLTREIEEVRKELERMLRPAAATAPASATAAGPEARDASTESGRTATEAARSASGAVRTIGNSSNSSSDPHQQHHLRHQPTHRRHRSVRELIEELYPPRVFSPLSSVPPPPPPSTVTAAETTESGARVFYTANSPTDTTGHTTSSSGAGSASGSSRHRRVSSGSIFHTAVKASPTHLTLTRQTAGAGSSQNSANHGGSTSSSSGLSGSGSAPASSTCSFLDSPMVEVHPITRSTGADVRQALWEQDIHPSSILMDCVQRYMEGHGLYRDPRKATAASLYAGMGGANDFANGPRGAGISGGAGGAASGGLGSSGAEGSSGGFRDPASAGVGGSNTSGSVASVGSTIIDGRTGIRRVAPRETSTLSFPGLIPRLELHYDRNNLLAREQYEKLRIFQCQDGEEPDLIVPIGGDGYMMHCIRKNWRRFIPFYGVNAGHVGYLLNDRSTLEELFSSPLKLHFTTMLYCQAEKEGDTGERVLLSELAFNDAWVERSSGQTALIRILVNGQERIRRLRGDGVLVSTAAGSTAYSQALGASPVPVGAPLIQVVGSNVVSPAQWRPAHLDQEDQVEFEVIDSTKRPCRCYVDSVDVGNVTRLLVRSSRVAGVTLAFSKSCDLQHKLYQMQFPKTL